MAYRNLAYAIYEMARDHPEQLAIAFPAAPGRPLPASGPMPYRLISFRELAFETNSVARGLLAHGFKAGDRVVLMVPPGLEFFTLCFACMQTGIVPILIDPGIGLKYLKTCINETSPVGFIGITKAHIARVLLGWGRATIQKNVQVGGGMLFFGIGLNTLRKKDSSKTMPACVNPAPDDLAAIIYTSGSTGIAKGVMYTHDSFQHQVEVIRETFHTQPGDIDLPTFPPFALFNPAAGMSTVIPDMDARNPVKADPERIVRAVNQFNVTSLFASPALIDKLGRYGIATGAQLPGLKRAFSAGAPVPSKALERFSKMLMPGTPVYTPYGSTEAMPVCVISSHQILTENIQSRTASGSGICIGQPAYSMEVRIIRISDDPIEVWEDGLECDTGEVGEIVVKGANVTRAYYNRDKETSLAKIQSGPDFYHRMGDLGYRDEDGNFWFCGRKSQRVRLQDKDLFTIPCEYIFNRHPQVYRTALVGVDMVPVLCVELEKGVPKGDWIHIKQELLALARVQGMTKDIQQILLHPSFPVDRRHNAKIAREKLAQWAAKQMGK